ncbi:MULTISPECIES: CsbD family protein [Mesorhizobium]|uniref:CsbD family protein n=1 Tax=Mesorhizobium abyssinicae TaxID=1209958 RepID=A0ABU5AUL8_9HYPH|nr:MULTISPECIES: CsbD family protein [Mesorhizobium]RVC59980.1 CsbD family protein [Mesorhizobium sp. M4B.F.Ca.ET.088.02.2.1]MDX8433364.1 CsbD family protein [Mesorhizobium abyssinicae]MDX8540999.1 CsbD family protein [Mesorhizobium abyssinicae]RUW23042.1 CsbD family protein [Mesorhizobium sp. M4B.F.Ca.ET.013.02.1.1]RUW74961.1 CsbD family protein [Mesorhizobium sp. M4B.F.Ca.ET.049.02.1.2]
MVNIDQIAGLAKQIKGSIRQTVGKATGNRPMQIRGIADKATGKVQKACGDMKAVIKKAM